MATSPAESNAPCGRLFWVLAMPRPPRIKTQPNSGTDIMIRVILGLNLLMPSPELNSIIVGTLAKFHEKHDVEIYCGAFMGNHFHLYLKGRTQRDESDFMRDFTRKLSIESGILYDWPGSTFPNRYHGAEVSEEPEAQIRRLAYQLSNGTKEGLCDSPLDWPGVSFAEALISGEPMEGVWIDRTGYHNARKQGKDVTIEDFTEPMELRLTPLPCWQHEDQTTRRRYVLEIIRIIEEKAAARHAENETASLGRDFVLEGEPHYRPPPLEKKPQPRFHAYRDAVREDMRAAFGLILAAYLQAAEQLKAGNRWVTFPENTFPPGLPFLEPTWSSPASPRELWEPG